MGSVGLVCSNSGNQYISIVEVPQCEAEVFQISIPTAKKQQYSVRDINWLTLFKEVLAHYFEKHTKLVRIF